MKKHRKPTKDTSENALLWILVKISLPKEKNACNAEGCNTFLDIF